MELKTTWLGLSPPVVESSIMGKWYAGIYKMKKYSTLFVSRLLMQFLDDKNGTVNATGMRCLKLKVGKGSIL